MLVLVLSVIPVGPPPARAGWLDKVAHLCEYAVFAWLLLRARRSRAPHLTGRLAVWGIAFAYGLFLEGLQAFLPWRSAEWADAAANAVGAAAGVWLGEGHGRHRAVSGLTLRSRNRAES